MRQRKNIEHKELLEKIKEDAQHIIKIVSDDYVEMNYKSMKVGNSMINNYLPTPTDIAKFWKIRIKYKKMDGEMLSYLRRKDLIIFISDRYASDRYITENLIAHELGHFFSDQDELSAMNNDRLNEYLPTEIFKEYMANVYALFFEPRMLVGIGGDWEKYSYEELNKRMYERVFKME